MKRHASVQETHIPIDRIEDDVVYFVCGAARAVVEVTGVDFAHQGADEQGALVAGFAAFLNSLTFPLQIVLRAFRSTWRSSPAIWMAESNDSRRTSPTWGAITVCSCASWRGSGRCWTAIATS